MINEKYSCIRKELSTTYYKKQSLKSLYNFFCSIASFAGIRGEDSRHIPATSQVQHLRYGVLQQGRR